MWRTYVCASPSDMPPTQAAMAWRGRPRRGLPPPHSATDTAQVTAEELLSEGRGVFGEFFRQFRIPDDVDTGRAEAKYTEDTGMLHVHLPKLAVVPPPPPPGGPPPPRDLGYSPPRDLGSGLMSAPLGHHLAYSPSRHNPRSIDPRATLERAPHELGLF